MDARRRSLLVTMLAGLSAPALRAAPPPGRVLRLGLLYSTSREAAMAPPSYRDKALAERGYVEGKNLAYEWRFADFHAERLPALAAELVAKKVDIIIAAGTPCAIAAKNATSEIPVIGVTITNPVGNGLGASIARPGGNVTGITTVTGLATKGLETLVRLVPATRRLGWAYNPDNPGSAGSLKSLDTTGRMLKVEMVPIRLAAMQDLERELGSGNTHRLDAMYFPLDATINVLADRFPPLGLRQRLPGMGSLPRFVQAGGLACFAQSYAEQWSYVAEYVDRIANGTPAGELPFAQPNKFELGLNRATAKALGVAIPQELLLRADFVVE